MTTLPTPTKLTLCECGGKISSPHIRYCNECIGELLHENRVNGGLQSKIFNTTSIYPTRILESPCNECNHTSWINGTDGCNCICHVKTTFEDPLLPPASPGWIEFKEAYRIKRKPSGVKMTSEEKAAYRKAYLENNKEKRNAYRRKYYESNKDRHQAANKEYHETHKDEVRAWHKEYYVKNKDQILARNKRWRKTSTWYKEYYEKNKEKLNADHKEYYRKNSDKYRAYSKRYRAMRKLKGK